MLDRTFAAVLAAGVSLTAPGAPRAAPPDEAPRAAAFVVDPVADGAVLSLSLGFGALSQAILATGEMRPQPPAIPTDDLLWIDRAAAESPGNEGSALASDLLVGVAAAYALADTLRAGLDDGGDTGWTYLLLYAESASINWALTNLSKIAVRRPRPRVYLERDRAERRGVPFVPDETDDALSFYSGHTAMAAGLASTAAYLAFSRGDRLEAWLTVAGGAVLTGVVGWQRVAARDHFPTDVVAGAMAGAGIGLLVPHLHRVGPRGAAEVRVGALADDGHAGLTLSGRF